MFYRVFFIFYILLLIGCDHRRPAAYYDLDARAPERFALGAAVDAELNAVWELMQSARHNDLAWQRDLGWKLVSALVAGTSAGQSKHPRFLTWYSRSDLERLAQALARNLTSEQRFERTPFTDDMWLDAERAHTDAIRQWPHWSEKRLQELVNTFSDNQRWAGAHGVERVLYNPALARHLVKQLWSVENCVGVDCPLAAAPAGSVVVKLSWQRLGEEDQFPYYQTDREHLQRVIGQSEVSWTDLKAMASRPDESALTARLASGARYALTGFHVGAKLQTDWVWTTIWLSQNADADFGADRPRQLQTHGIWSHYKMCTVTDFTYDELNTDGVTAELAGIYDWLHAETASSSWCSNPYMERGANNQNTNCIGCHRHAGTGRSGVDLLATQTPFSSPLNLRNDQGSAVNDYLWTWGANDLGIMSILRKIARNQITQ